VISSLGILYADTRHTFKRITSTNGKNIDEQLCELWMKRFVVEALKGSFNLWINTCSRTIRRFELKESLEDLRNQNAEL
jgi:hypothetical protein